METKAHTDKFSILQMNKFEMKTSPRKMNSKDGKSLSVKVSKPFLMSNSANNNNLNICLFQHVIVVEI